MCAQIKVHSVNRIYKGIVIGNFKEEKGTVNARIGRNQKDRKKMAVVPDGREAITHFEVLEQYKGFSYVQFKLETGRTHQIRVHMANIKHPVFNDTLYGAGMAKIKTEEQVLQSFYLRFTKPFGNEIIELQIEPDEKIKKVLKYLRS